MKKIVVPVNFSASSDNAARYAADMALAIHAELHLVHFVQVPVSTADFPMNEYVFSEMEQSGTEGLNQLWDKLVVRTHGKVNIYTNMEVGNVEYRLEEFCTRTKPFMVVMGSAGPSLERALTGSNISAAIRHLPYPLIVVPGNAIFHQYKKIMLACDLDDIAAGVPVNNPLLKEFQNNFDCNFEVINISTKQMKVEEGISEYLSNHPADLLLVFPKKHNFLEFHKSHAKKIALHSSIPVMSMHCPCPE